MRTTGTTPCTLTEAARRLGIDPYTRDRLRERLRRRGCGQTTAGGTRYRLRDVAKALRDDQALQARRAERAAAPRPTDPCPVCGAPVPQHWRWDRCMVCLTGKGCEV